MGFEPTRAEHNGLAVHRLNHSATSSPQENPANVVVFFSLIIFLQHMHLFWNANRWHFDTKSLNGCRRELSY